MYLLWKRLLNTTQIKHDYLEKPAGLQWRSNKLFIVATVGIGLFTDLFLYGLIVPVLPFMLVDRVGLPPDQVQGHVSSLLAAYAGASVAISPIAGIITDRLSTRRAPFLLGVVALFGATLLLMVGRTIPVLLVARVLQGISAAFVWTTGMALCLETVGAENLGKSIGAIFGFISVGTLLAPMLGGVLYDKGGLAGVFGLAFAVLAVDFIMRVLVIEVKVARRYEPSDAGASDALVTGANQPQAGVTDEEEEGGRDELSSLLRNTRKGEDLYKISPNLPKVMRIIPILPCLAAPRLVAALLISFVQAVLLGSIDATVPIVSQEYYNFSSLQAGLMFLPIGIANLTFGPLLGWCVDRFGTKRVAVLVYLYLVPVLISFRLAKPGGVSEVAVYETLLALAGIGVAGMGAPSVVEASTVVQKYHQANPDFFGEHGPYAQLYSLSYLFFSLGLTVGPELAGGLRQAVGYGNMNAVLAAICAVTALVCFLFIGGKLKMSALGNIA
ncbi:major facilitator superfamily domain-containing protein [Bisporella sp. PMI_857]|nr:major facilitator superfamily domain-containing protein [Bisporella sp. PMI_857]